VAKYAAELSPRALEDIQTRSPDVAARILRKLRDLEDSPFPRRRYHQASEGLRDPDLPPPDR